MEIYNARYERTARIGEILSEMGCRLMGLALPFEGEDSIPMYPPNGVWTTVRAGEEGPILVSTMVCWDVSGEEQERLSAVVRGAEHTGRAAFRLEEENTMFGSLTVEHEEELPEAVQELSAQTDRMVDDIYRAIFELKEGEAVFPGIIRDALAATGSQFESERDQDAWDFWMFPHDMDCDTVCLRVYPHGEGSICAKLVEEVPVERRDEMLRWLNGANYKWGTIKLAMGPEGDVMLAVDFWLDNDPVSAREEIDFRLEMLDEQIRFCREEMKKAGLEFGKKA